MTETYDQFLRNKTAVAQETGFDCTPEEVHPLLRPHQREAVLWAVRGGRRALFESFGLGKTIQQLEICRLILMKSGGGKGLIVCPLGVKQEFTRDAAMLGTPIRFIRTTAEADGEGLFLTNYESVREGKLNPTDFTVVSLDEAAILRGFGGTKTFRTFMGLFEGTSTYRFVATATPDPNEYIELAAYADFLGIMDTGEIKTRFFKRDATKADKLTLHAHKSTEFWLWVGSWALFLQKPSDLCRCLCHKESNSKVSVSVPHGLKSVGQTTGKSIAATKWGGQQKESLLTYCDGCRCDEGYDLPPMTVRWHEVPTDHSLAIPDRDGQGRMFKDVVFGLSEAAAEKRQSLGTRLAKMVEIVEASPDEHFVLWHDLEAERHAITKAIPGVTAVYGSQDLEDREQAIIGFSDGKLRHLAGKPSMLGAGVNWQYHCHRAVFLGISFKFNDFIQAIHRVYRFLQSKPVVVDLIYTEAERSVKKILEDKWKRYARQSAHMSVLIREHGLANISMAQSMQRSIGVTRQAQTGEHFTLVNNDCVLETAQMPVASVDLIVTSIPFCYDQETEILTRRGWIGFGNLTTGDEVATVNRNRLCFEWQAPTRIVWESYQGEMLQFGNRSFDLLVTPNHRLFVARRGTDFHPGKLRLVEAKQIALDYEDAHRKSLDSGRILRGWRTCLIPPATGVGAWPSRIDLPPLPEDIRSGHGVELYWIETEDFMALAGWYLSEGHADALDHGRSGGRISIAQVTNEKLRREIHDLFVRIGLPPSMHARQITVWCRNLAYFLIKEFGTGSKQKHIPAWLRECHPHLLRILRDTMMKGDGSKDGRYYTSYSKALRDDFQEICLKTGWRATIKGNNVQLGSAQIYPEIRQAPKRVDYSGMIGCATVPNGLLIVRRNGKPCVGGNSSQYEYTPSMNDFGHTDSNAHFWQQMDFLSPELLRVLSPGRVMCIHVKDRIVPGGLTGLGFQTLHPFHAEAIFHYQRHGFAFLGMKTIVTDVVRENNQTYRLGWSEQCKDGSRMGCGVPEYILLFRKPPTDSSNGYGDVPIVKLKPVTMTPNGERIPYDYDGGKIVPGTGYSRATWQLDAHGFARSNGNRFLTPEEINLLPHEKIYKLWRQESLSTVYDFDRHVHLGEMLEQEKRLPSTFMAMPPHSWHPDVWTDIARMRTLNMDQQRRGQEMHLAPLQLDTVNRLITQLSMPGETCFDPFSGLGTVVYCALKLGRKGIGIELNARYHADAVRYCREAELQRDVPTLFDLEAIDTEEPAVYALQTQQEEACADDA